MITVGPEDFQMLENNIVDTMFTYIHIIIIILMFSVLFFQQRMQIFLFEKKHVYYIRQKKSLQNRTNEKITLSNGGSS